MAAMKYSLSNTVETEAGAERDQNSHRIVPALYRLWCTGPCVALLCLAPEHWSREEQEQGQGGLTVGSHRKIGF